MEHSNTNLEAEILRAKQEGKELISEGEHQRHQYMSLSNFFMAAQAVRRLVDDGTLREIHQAASLKPKNLEA